MKKILTGILLLTICFPQTSSLSLYGLGELQQSVDPASIGVGDCSYFSSRIDGVSLTSPSSHWRSSLTRLNIATSFNWNTADSISPQFGQLVNYLSFAVSTGKSKVISVGFKPYTRNNYSIIENMNQDLTIFYNGETLNYNTHYTVDGGVSDLFLSYSTLISEKFSVGLQWNVGFGTQSRINSIFVYKPIIDYYGEVEYQLQYTDIIEIDDRFRSNTYIIEGRYSGTPHEFVIGFEYSAPMTIISNRTNNITIAPETKNTTKGQISNIGVGYAFKSSSNIGVVCEYHQREAVKLPEEVTNFNNQFAELQRDVHFGLSKQFHNKNLGIWKNIVVSGGTFAKQFAMEKINYYDIGLTAGLILEWGKSKNSVSLGLKVGSRTNEFIEFTGEKYINLTVGFTAGETWFIKRKRK